MSGVPILRQAESGRRFSQKTGISYNEEERFTVALRSYLKQYSLAIDCYYQAREMMVIVLEPAYVIYIVPCHSTFAVESQFLFHCNMPDFSVNGKTKNQL